MRGNELRHVLGHQRRPVEQGETAIHQFPIPMRGNELAAVTRVVGQVFRFRSP